MWSESLTKPHFKKLHFCLTAENLWSVTAIYVKLYTQKPILRAVGTSASFSSGTVQKEIIIKLITVVITTIIIHFNIILVFFTTASAL